MSKVKADNLHKISIFSLKAYGLLTADSYCEIYWGSNIAFAVRVESHLEPRTISFSYWVTDDLSGEKQEVICGCWLTTTTCNLGGQRYWFTCLCGRRVAMLYQGSEGFRCRHCYGLTYESRNESKKWRYSALCRAARNIEKIDKLEKKPIRVAYAGKCTKRFMRKLQLCAQNSKYQRLFDKEDLL